ncbi:MAG: hypothetical protein ACOYNC_12280 [Bacteroidales bacterium]
MENITTTSSVNPQKSKQELRQINNWQKKLLPWLVIMPTVLILLFIFLATQQMQRFNSIMDVKPGSDIEKMMVPPSDPSLSPNLKGNMDYIRWVTLAKMEEKSLDRRYSQGGLLLVSRIFTKYLGFFTGMILAIVGAVFIIGKLQEDKTDMEGSMGEQVKMKLTSSSPGIIFGVLGTILMLSTILQHTDITVSDQPLFLNPYNVHVNSVEKGTSVPSSTDPKVKSLQQKVDSLSDLGPN